MPRLLLVDDNPSIHKIAETLLATTDVALVCAESGEEALGHLDRGERFDAALVDTQMPGMDGWQLLERLREHAATARMPIAMMAGVLDDVDPARIQAAPIQAFLKKPVELRDLGQRVHHLMDTPVPEPAPRKPSWEESPFATMPGMPLEDVARMMPPAEASAGAPAPPPEDGLLLLAEADLFPEEIAAEIEEGERETPVGEIPLDEVPLELEELDLEGLRTLATPPEPPVEPVPLPEPVPEPEPELIAAELPDLGPEAPPPAPLPETPATSNLPVPEGSMTEDLLSLEDWAAPPPPTAFPVAEPVVFAPAPPALPDEPEDESEEVDLILDGEEPPAPLLPEVPALPPPASPIEAAVPAPPALPLAPESPAAADLVRAIAQDPALVDALAREVVRHLGDKVLREIAWDLMPDLADRLRRP